MFIDLSGRYKAQSTDIRDAYHESSTPYGAGLCLDLLTQDVLERDSVGGEFRDTLAELLDGQLVLVEVKAEVGLVVDVALLLNIELGDVL
jgi:hypothetical protein